MAFEFFVIKQGMIKKIDVSGNFHLDRKSIFHKLLIFMEKNYKQCSVKTAHCF